MDRPRRRSGLLIALAALGLAAAAPLDVPPLRAMRWLAPGADVARILTRQPVECLKPAADAETAYRIEVGRAAFRTPLLLGGQAARAGISCAGCHRNGRTNPDFDFPGVSGAPGTADVTSSLFSARRGDGIDNPKPIPDLGGLKSRLKISQSPGSPALRSFVGGLITEEFDGPPPPPAVLDGLVAYVRAMDPARCDLAVRAPLRAGGAIAEVRRAARTAGTALARGDRATAVVMLESARSQLGDIAERYGDRALAPTGRAIAAAARDLTDVIETARRGSPEAPPRLAAWLTRSATWAAPVRRDEGRSLYAPAVLARAAPGR